MTKTTEDFCNEPHTYFYFSNSELIFLTPPTFIPYLLAISEHYLDNILKLISSFSGANR